MKSEVFYMQPATGAVFTETEAEDLFNTLSPEEWGGEKFDDAGLVRVLPNRPEYPWYNAMYGDWIAEEVADAE